MCNIQGSAQSDLSGTCVALRMSHYCNQSAFGAAFPTFYSIVSGGQNSVSGGKRRLSGV